MKSKGDFPIRKGKVYLVGAGPGHPELLTLKAAELLRQADVIVYDRLIQEEVLALAKPSAERLYMGKPLGRHDSRQQEICELLMRKAREDKLVVRLKGGDPFLFGRGGEEAGFLAEHGVPFDVIPGVSSALAAPLSAGIALTHRDISSAVAIVTGHEARKDESRVDWGALARIDTLVFLMGLANVGVIARKLIEHGRDPATPAAVIQQAYWPREQVVAATLATIQAEVERAEVQPPATLVVGNVVAAREKLLQAEPELRRQAGAAELEPAPGADQLLRLATAGLGSQVLYFALAIGLFDELETFRTVPALAREFGLNSLALEDILDSLAVLGLVERNESGYRNLELASSYLANASGRSLAPMLLHLAAQSSQESLGRYALDGPKPDLDQEGDERYFQACESMARLAAAGVTARLKLDGGGPVLVAGWGCQAYREEFERRWPGVEVTALNPFLPPGGDLAAIANGESFGVILLSCPLASSRRGQVDLLLTAAANAVRPGGQLILHDAFLPGGALPPPEVVLGGLGRRIYHGTGRTWSVDRLRSALEPLGFGEIRAVPVNAGMLLVTAAKTDG